MSGLPFFLFFLVLALAFLPILIEIDTQRQVYTRINVGGLFKAWAEASEQGWFVGFQLPFFSKKFDLLRFRKTPKRKKEKLSPEKKPKRAAGKGKFPSPLRLLRAFRLHSLEWKLDTGD